MAQLMVKVMLVAVALAGCASGSSDSTPRSPTQQAEAEQAERGDLTLAQCRDLRAIYVEIRRPTAGGDLSVFREENGRSVLSENGRYLLELQGLSDEEIAELEKEHAEFVSNKMNELRPLMVEMIKGGCPDSMTAD